MPIRKEFLEKITNNTFTERSISLLEEGLKCEDVTELARCLVNNTHVESLSISDIPIEDECLKILSKIKNLKSLNIQNCEVSDIGISYLINKNCSLNILHASSNFITDNGILGISENKTLKYLDLSYNKITANGANIISKNELIEELDLSHSPLFFSKYEKSGKLELDFSENKSLKKLDISSIGRLRNIGSIVNFKALESINLSYNRVNREDITELTKSETITELNFSCCNLDDSYADLLVSMKALNKLELFQNKFTEKGAKILLQSHIETVNFGDNLIKYESPEQEQEGKSFPTALAFLYDRYRKGKTIDDTGKRQKLAR